MPRSWDDLFWMALLIVAGAVIVFAAKALFAIPKPQRGRVLPVFAGLGVVLLTACASAPLPPPSPEATVSPTDAAYGWSSPHMPIDHNPPTGRDLLQRT